VLVLHGADRHGEFDAISSHDLVITTYPLLHRDIARLETRSWRIVLLDEAQAVKNPAAAVAKHIRRLRSRSRIALTGTPLENNLEDIWALFDWLIPGLLGDRKSFKTKFRTPIEREGDQRAQALLNARLRPFLLRRTKEEVARDLPDKTEIVEFIPLVGRQRALYEAIRLSMDKRVRDAIAAKGFAASRITILDALLKLRQVCCDPLLLEKAAEADESPGSRKPLDRTPLPSPASIGHAAGDPQDGAKDSAKDSAKRAHLLTMLEQLVAEGRRILVFSQFTSMLDIIAADIRERGWEFAWLTGKTKRRDEVVSAFQSGTAPIFLISLKAGGVGLTLTAADTVILYDPWWNPAAERQAMDRTHRIGQTKKVFVYRLAAEGSVEERIMAMQERKQAMADALFAGPEAGPLALDETQIMELFAPLAATEV
jgi:SNF2 family DNA or RNA helicase